MPEKPKKSKEDVIREDGRYPLEAFVFLEEGLLRAVEEIYGEHRPDEHQHVTGRQLCKALRDLAIDKWGMLAPTVLKRWNIHATIDFGNMVYLLVNSGLMDKQPDDSLEDFRDVYHFAAAFDLGEELGLKE